MLRWEQSRHEFDLPDKEGYFWLGLQSEIQENRLAALLVTDNHRSENSMNEVGYIDLHAYARNSDLKLENSQETPSSPIGWACTKIIPDLFGRRVG